MKIGITADVNLTSTDIINLQLANFAPKPLIDVLVKNGVIPVIFPIVPPEMAKELLELVDGLIIPGGQDVAPIMFHGEPSVHTGASYQPRDEIEFQLVREAKKMGKPLFGICRGIQVVNLALGGSVYQDLESEFPSHDLLQHKQKTLGSLPVHTVKIQKGSLLNQVFGNSAYVNSRHHQAVKNVAADLHVVAKAPDGVIEGLEDDQGLIQLVQWHPENLWQSDLKQEELFKAFFRRVSEYK